MLGRELAEGIASAGRGEQYARLSSGRSVVSATSQSAQVPARGKRADALQSDSSGFDALHTYFLDRLVPVCTQLLDAAVSAGEIRPGTHAYELMRGIGNLCIGRDSDPRYDPRRLVELLLQGLQRPQPA